MGGKAIELGFPPGLFGQGPIGGTGQGLGQGGVPVASELGEELVADTVTGEGGVAVGGVFTPGEGALAEPGFDFGAVEGEEGADQAVGGNGPDTGQPGGSGAAKKAEEHGFGLVGAGVAEGDAVQAAGLEEFGEEPAAGVAGRLLQVITGFLAEPGHVDLGQMEGQAEAGGEVADEGGIAGGLAGAQAMVEVQDLQAQIPAGRELAEDVEQADGIRAAGDSHSHPLGRLKHVITSDVSGHTLQHT